MAIAFDAATATATAQGTSANISHACTGSDRLLIFTAGTDGRAQSITSATYNGVALTRAIRRQHTNTDTFAGFEELWYLVNPASGTNTLTLNLSTSMQVQVVVSSYTGVHQSTPLGTAAGADGVSTAPSVIVGSAGDEMVVDGLGFYKDPAAASTLTPGAGQTRNGAAQVSFGNNFVHGSSSREAGAASVTMSWTSSQNDNWVLVAVPIKPAGATAYTLTADPGSVAVTGTAASLEAHRRLSAEAGSVAITGTDISTELVRLASPGAVTITGTDAALFRGRSLSAEAGSVSISGTAASLEATRSLSAEAGAVALTGAASSLEAARTLPADSGSVALTGTAASLEAHRKVTAEAGSVAVTGSDATLTYEQPGEFTLTAESGSVALTGTDATLRADRTLGADSGSVALTGTAANLLRGRLLVVDAGSFSLTGQTATLTATRRITASAGAYTISGTAATLTWSGEELPVPPFSATLSVSTRSPSLSVTARTPSLSVEDA